MAARRVGGAGRCPCPWRDGPHSACRAALEDWGQRGFWGEAGSDFSLLLQSPHWQDLGAPREWSPLPSHQDQLSASKEQLCARSWEGSGCDFLISQRFLLISTKKALRVSKAGN